MKKKKPLKLVVDYDTISIFVVIIITKTTITVSSSIEVLSMPLNLPCNTRMVL